MQHGFEKVTVADVARVADVSVNTVFNYFKTKEDLFADRQDVVEQLLSDVVRQRPAGESALDALRRDFLDALEQRHWRAGFTEGTDVFARLVAESVSLQAKLRELHERREDALARTLAEETDADPDDVTPRLVAAQVLAVIRSVSADFVRRKLAGQTLDEMYPQVRANAERGFDLLRSGIGDYATK